MNKKIIPWVDPYTNESLIEEDNLLKSSEKQYAVIRGIPNFVNDITNSKQNQVKDTFGFKWNTTDYGQTDDEFENKIKPLTMEFMGLEEKDLSIFNDKLVLDVGVGSGSSARLWAKNSKEFHGIDISDAIYRAPNALSLYNNVVLSKSDLNHLPYSDEVFEIIVSNGVLHHTPNTKIALKNIIQKLKPSGLCLFYIYKKKGPIREFSDDFIRSKISDMDYDQALKSLTPITAFAKSLHEKNVTITIDQDIPLLKIKKGQYDLQRFIYQNFFKCFWNDSFGFDDSNLTNFDWYYPKFSWRHTEKEIRQWCSEFNLEIKFLKEIDSGYSCMVMKR